VPDHIATADPEVRFLFQNTLNMGEMLFPCLLSESGANIAQSLSWLGCGIDS
jgi:hypothetical protein